MWNPSKLLQCQERYRIINLSLKIFPERVSNRSLHFKDVYSHGEWIVLLSND